MLNLPIRVLERTGLVILFYNFFICLPSIIEETAPDPNRTLSELNLVLPSLPFVFPTVQAYNVQYWYF